MEEIQETTKREAYHYMLVWAKILLEKGYKCFNDEFLIERTNYLYHWNQRLYEERKAVEIEEKFSCEKCLVPTYRNFPCENNEQQPDEHKKEISSTEIVSKAKKTGRREKIIRIKVSANEYETILQNATENNKQVAPYIREVAQNPIIHNFDYPEITEHTKNVAEVTTTLRQLIWSIEASNNYLPKEIDSIVEMITYVFKTENELRTELHKERIKSDNRKKRTRKSNKQKR